MNELNNNLNVNIASAKIVIGLGFGDEGKGITTSFLSSLTGSPIVIRSNGGHQAGHTVVHEGNRHVFSNFGSGTLQGVPTYWNEQCTFSPLGVLNEYNALRKIQNINPRLFVHPLCPVTTPYDRFFNQQLEKSNKTGSCGVGFGATLQRQEDFYKLFVQDLYHEKILIQKLKGIRNYYAKKFSTEPHLFDDAFGIKIDDFLCVVNEIKDIIKNVTDGSHIAGNYIPIFEGAQGVLLDQDFGFFPNVTRSNTTTKNPIETYKKLFKIDDNRFGGLSTFQQVETFYVTRTYQTRHGNGFMSNEEYAGELNLKNNEFETNVTNEWQGNFKKTVLDLDLLDYALVCDKNFSSGIKKNLVITCVDQTGERIKVTQDGKLREIDIDALSKRLDCAFSNVYISRGDSFKDITLLK
jgi:adenylosuccinate synthase